MILIDQALRTGQLWVKMPPTLILLASAGVTLLALGAQVQPPWIYLCWFIGLSGWPMSVVYRAYATARWKLWAYRNGVNVAALRHAAQVGGILLPEKSPFAKLELCSAADSAEIARFEGRSV